MGDIVCRSFVDFQPIDRKKNGVLVRLGCIIQDIVWVSNVGLNVEDNRLVWESLLEIILQVVVSKLHQLLSVLGVILG